MSKRTKNFTAAKKEKENPKIGLDWDKLWGFDQYWQQLTTLVRGEAFPSILLFAGRDGMGKRTFLRGVSSLFFCESQTGCGTCSSCQALKQGCHPDVFTIDTHGEPIKLEKIEKLQEHLEYYPNWQGPHSARVAIICDADLLTRQAANRLLKTLEESSSCVRILLSTSKVRQILPTILSRCVRWRLAPPLMAESLQRLKSLNPMVEDKTIRHLLMRFGLAPGKVLKVLEEGSGFCLESEELCRDLLNFRDLKDIMEAGARIASSRVMNVSLLREEVERGLNRLYWEALKSGRSFSRQMLIERRALLTKLAKASAQKIPLNLQLACESIGLVSFIR